MLRSLMEKVENGGFHQGTVAEAVMCAVLVFEKKVFYVAERFNLKRSVKPERFVLPYLGSSF